MATRINWAFALAAVGLLCYFGLEFGDSNQAWASHHKEGNQEAPEHHTPRFLRQNDRRYSAGYLDTKTDQYVSMVEENDFDASYDGKKWFHLLGRVCLRGLKPK